MSNLDQLKQDLIEGKIDLSVAKAEIASGELLAGRVELGRGAAELVFGPFPVDATIVALHVGGRRYAVTFGQGADRLVVS